MVLVEKRDQTVTGLVRDTMRTLVVRSTSLKQRASEPAWTRDPTKMFRVIELLSTQE
jgi:hypothetical protein